MTWCCFLVKYLEELGKVDLLGKKFVEEEEKLRSISLRVYLSSATVSIKGEICFHV